MPRARRRALAHLVSALVAVVAATVGFAYASTTASRASDADSIDFEYSQMVVGPGHPAVHGQSEASSLAFAYDYDPALNLARTNARLDGDRLAPQSVLKLPTSQTWGRLDTLDDHFLRHGADFGARSADDYARQSSQFLQGGVKQGLPTKIDPKTGVIRVYDPTANTFGAYNPTGTTRTFYKPDPAAHGYATNWDYWQAQPGYAP